MIATHDECAKDMQVALDMFGWSDDEMPGAKSILARGGTVLMPCPICQVAGHPHTLEVHMADGKFVVLPA